jgi:hypothetical protein
LYLRFKKHPGPERAASKAAGYFFKEERRKGEKEERIFEF